MSEKKASALNPLHSKNIPPPPAMPTSPVSPVERRVPEQKLPSVPAPAGLSELPERDEERATIELSLYLRPSQDDKIEDLRRAYKRQTGKKISANEIIRRLIDQADLRTILGEP